MIGDDEQPEVENDDYPALCAHNAGRKVEYDSHPNHPRIPRKTVRCGRCGAILSVSIARPISPGRRIIGERGD